MKHRILGLFLTFAIAGCGGSSSGDNASCDVTVGTSHSCLDYEGLTNAQGQTDALKAACMMVGGGVFRSGTLCTHTGAVVGCRQQPAGTNFKQTTWQYQGPKMCSGSGVTLVDP